MNNLEIQRGNPYSATLTFTDSNGAYDLTGKTVLFTVKKIDDVADNDTTALITKDISVHTDATGGITTLELTAVQTTQPCDRYKYDVRIYESGVQLNTDTAYIDIVDLVTKRTT
jgi:hypothetical protein